VALYGFGMTRKTKNAAFLGAAVFSTLYIYFSNLGGVKWTFAEKYIYWGSSDLRENGTIWGLDKISGILGSKG
jgi:hypothetical protein